jgi:hypothetical protein
VSVISAASWKGSISPNRGKINKKKKFNLKLNKFNCEGKKDKKKKKTKKFQLQAGQV